MNNLSLYLATVLIWGSTWLAIKFQLGAVPVEWSVVYRFGLAALLLLAYCLARGLNLRFSRRDHAFMALQGCLLFCLNYVLIYHSEMHLSSGLVAVLFSSIVFLNTLNTRLFFGTPIEPKVVVSAALGFTGISMVFWPELASFNGQQGMAGVWFGLAATTSASLGNMVSSRNQRAQIPVIQGNAFGMLYGALAVAVYTVLAGKPMVFDWGGGYVWSLVYLAVFGSILAFGAYLTLIGRIGADRASYAGVVIPIVALLLSTVFEGFQWHASTIIGIALCLSGNVLILQKKRPTPVLKPAAQV
ncbi:DMT family transporter [Chitinivorax sp. PXF-14]|uniref:DMT family transporter n=1 Tax=Chitinivorax sp. PXF-14 TaxID=3230488 RepID=UPI003465849C